MKKVVIFIFLFFCLFISAQSIPEGWYYIRSSYNPNYVIDLNTSNATNGNNIHIWEFNGTNAQLWIFEAISTNNQNNSSNKGPQLHMIVCPSCGGGGKLPWENYITCKTCGGTGMLVSYQ